MSGVTYICTCLKIFQFAGFWNSLRWLAICEDMVGNPPCLPTSLPWTPILTTPPTPPSGCGEDVLVISGESAALSPWGKLGWFSEDFSWLSQQPQTLRVERIVGLSFLTPPPFLLTAGDLAIPLAPPGSWDHQAGIWEVSVGQSPAARTAPGLTSGRVRRHLSSTHCFILFWSQE